MLLLWCHWAVRTSSAHLQGRGSGTSCDYNHSALLFSLPSIFPITELWSYSAWINFLVNQVRCLCHAGGVVVVLERCFCACLFWRTRSRTRFSLGAAYLPWLHSVERSVYAQLLRPAHTMESGVVHIYKEDRCPPGHPEDCVPNFTWQPSSSDMFNSTPNGTWDTDVEPMSPLIPIIVAVYSVVFVVGLVGNCLVMYVIIRWVSSLKKYQVVDISIVDLLEKAACVIPACTKMALIEETGACFSAALMHWV